MTDLPLWADPPMRLGDARADRPCLAAFPVAGDRARAAMLILPGGGYGHHAAHEGEPVARWLNTLGIAAFVLRYRVAPYRHPVPLLDATRAIRTIRYRASDWGIDPHRVGIIGFSAGGHLAGLVATEQGPAHPGSRTDAIDSTDHRPSVAVLCYAVATLTGPAAHAGSAANLLGPHATEEQRRQLSISQRVTTTAPPTFLWHTADDASVPVDNTLQVAAALATHGVPVEAHIYPHGQHGLGLAQDEPVVAEWTRAAADFLTRYLTS
jgi:acetyl esterase/lipase